MAASQLRTIQKKKEIAPAIELHQLAPGALQLQQRVSGDAMVEACSPWTSLCCGVSDDDSAESALNNNNRQTDRVRLTH
jgi:hypothetical protein